MFNKNQQDVCTVSGNLWEHCLETHFKCCWYLMYLYKSYAVHVPGARAMLCRYELQHTLTGFIVSEVSWHRAADDVTAAYQTFSLKQVAGLIPWTSSPDVKLSCVHLKVSAKQLDVNASNKSISFINSRSANKTCLSVALIKKSK